MTPFFAIYYSLSPVVSMSHRVSSDFWKISKNGVIQPLLPKRHYYIDQSKGIILITPAS
ncbi:hypothetical protein [Bacillus taeanensis]|uniref:hypothetical protein n=1 Tax=Bacillus taeanensis TaxID=273032 RepID=UPI0015F0E099|nr:hypothetical protein [Bacillus taeanensis]